MVLICCRSTCNMATGTTWKLFCDMATCAARNKTPSKPKPACPRSWTQVIITGMPAIKTVMTSVAGDSCSYITTVPQAAGRSVAYENQPYDLCKAVIVFKVNKHSVIVYST